MSIESQKSSRSDSAEGSSLYYFEGQKDSRCGVHALNNLFRNYDGPTFIRNVLFTHGKCRTSSLDISKKIDVDDLCKEVLKEKLQGKQGKEKKSIKEHWECNTQGNYRIEILERAIAKTGIEVIDYDVQLTEVEIQGTEKAKDDFYLQLKARAENERGLLGFLVQNLDYEGHYVAILPRNGKLLWVDSADNWKSEKIEKRPFKNGRWTGFKYLTRKKFRKLVTTFTGVYELVDLEKTQE